MEGTAADLPRLEELLHWARCASIGELCLPHSLTPDLLQHLHRAGIRHRELRRGEHLFSQGQPLRSLHIVSRGLIETSVIDHEGHEQITGFHLPPDLVGLDAFHSHVHLCTATAAVPAHVHSVPLSRLQPLIDRVAAVRASLSAVISKSLAEHEQLLMVVNQRAATERVAVMLFSLSCRLGNNGSAAAEVPLVMSRAHMANYLGLAKETVVRIIGELDQAGIVARTRNGKRLRITDLGRLVRLAAVPVAS